MYKPIARPPDKDQGCGDQTHFFYLAMLSVRAEQLRLQPFSFHIFTHHPTLFFSAGLCTFNLLNTNLMEIRAYISLNAEKCVAVLGEVQNLPLAQPCLIHRLLQKWGSGFIVL